MRSPCIRVCQLDGEQVCVGCGRTGAEIARWGAMSDAQRDAVMARLGFPPVEDAEGGQAMDGGGGVRWVTLGGGA